MSLIERLRPKWHHADPEVRASAVRELGKDDQEILASVARQDEDERVRRIALKKLEDPQVLLELAEKDPNEGLRNLAAERAGIALAALATSNREMQVCEDALSRLTDPKHLTTTAATAFHPAIRQAAMSRLSDEKSLGEVATRASDPSIRQEALSRISDISVLRRITLSDAPSEFALAALEKIDHPDTLLGIAGDRTAQKAVRQRAQARLELVVSDDHPIRIKQRRERQLELCVAVETVASDAGLEEASTQIRNAQGEWEALAARTEPKEHVAQRFRQACETVLDELGRLARRRAEKERRDSELQEGLSARIALCEKVECLEGDDALRELEEARAAWSRLALLPEGQGESLSERFSRACESCKSRYERAQAEQAFQSRMEGLVNEAEQLLRSKRLEEALQSRAAVEKRWAKLGSPPETSDWKETEARLRERFKRAGQQLLERQERDRERQEQQKQENLTRLEELCSRLEGMARSEAFNLREADRELREMPVSWKIGPLPSSESRNSWKERLSDARQQLFRRLQDQKETEEWRRWANADVQQQLIRRAEALLETEDLGEVAKELRRIQEEWKRFGTAPPGQSQALWEQFRRVKDELRSRCDAYFADNLKKKEALCEKVEILADSTQWKETAETIKQIQAEWKQIGPVHNKKSEALWSRFRKPCDRFFEARNEHFGRIKQEREENEKKKVALCEKVEALADSSDWEEVTEQIKQIQAEWKQIGPVSRENSEALWNRFREACDHFFDRRKRRGELELEEKLRRAEAICSDLESLVSSFEGAHAPRPGAVGQKVSESWDEWGRVGWIPPEQAEPFDQRFRRACEQIVAAYPESLRGTELDPRTTRKKREKLCARLERLIESHTESAKAPSAENLAEKLKQAMAASAFGGSSTPERKKDWRATMQEAERVKASWERLGPIIEDADQALADRFQKTYSRLLDLRRAPAPRRDGAETPPSN